MGAIGAFLPTATSLRSVKVQNTEGVCSLELMLEFIAIPFWFAWFELAITSIGLSLALSSFGEESLLVC